MKRRIDDSIGIYIGMTLLERDLKYQEWLKAGKPISFGPKVHKPTLLERLVSLKERLLASKRAVRLPKISTVNKTPIIRSI